MSKITGITESNQIVGKNNIQPAADPALFQKTLEEALETKGSPKIETTAAGSALGEIQSVAPTMMDDPSMSLGNRTEKLLDKLDEYIQDLGDPNKTLKEIEPAVTNMKERADALMERAATEGVQDKNLQELIEGSAMIANIEYIKFNRGDYI